MTNSRLIAFVGLSLFIILLAGCSKNVTLKGTVVFSDDNTPVTGGVIIFTDGKHASRGTINADGTFEMGFVGTTDGIPPGTYSVYFWGVVSESSGETMTAINPHTGEKMEIPSMGTHTPLIDPKYDKPETSGLQVEVTRQTKAREFKVDRYKPNK